MYSVDVDKLLHAQKSIFNFLIGCLDITLLKINKCCCYEKQR